MKIQSQLLQLMPEKYRTPRASDSLVAPSLLSSSFAPFFSSSCVTPAIRSFVRSNRRGGVKSIHPRQAIELVNLSFIESNTLESKTNGGNEHLSLVVDVSIYRRYGLLKLKQYSH